jgi:hypothetical protein
VLDAVLAADPIEQNLPVPGPNLPVNTLPLSVKISTPIERIA